MFHPSYPLQEAELSDDSQWCRESGSFTTAFPIIMKRLNDSAPGERVTAWEGKDRLLIQIGAGTSSAIRCLGFCAIGGLLLTAFLIWNALNRPGGPVIEEIAVLVVAFVLTIPVLGGYIYARFGKTGVRIEPGWLEIENSLFGLASRKEYSLGLGAGAMLVATHRIFGELSYGIRISAIGEQPIFGRWLFEMEQHWIVQQINRHLGHDDWERTIVDSNPEIEYSIMDGFRFGED